MPGGGGVRKGFSLSYACLNCCTSLGSISLPHSAQLIGSWACSRSSSSSSISSSSHQACSDMCS